MMRTMIDLGLTDDDMKKTMDVNTVGIGTETESAIESETEKLVMVTRTEIESEGTDDIETMEMVKMTKDVVSVEGDITKMRPKRIGKIGENDDVSEKNDIGKGTMRNLEDIEIGISHATLIDRMVVRETVNVIENLDLDLSEEEVESEIMSIVHTER